jgi:acyl-CoA thioester hydrolase
VATPYVIDIPTRWNDNDVYGHVNNTEYYAFFDTAINTYLIEAGGLDIHDGSIIGLCVESHCEFKAALAFPDTIVAALTVGKLGNSSVRYELELSSRGSDAIAANGYFVHVFVDRETRRPVPIPEPIRDALARLA